MSWFRSPKKIQELIKHEVEKCQSWYQAGNFWLVVRVPAAKLKSLEAQQKIAQSSKQMDAPLPSILLISSDAKTTVKDEYIKLAGKGSPDTIDQEIIVTGQYTADKKKTTYIFTYDTATQAAGRKVFDDMVLNAFLALALWTFMPKECTKVYWHGSQPPKKLDDAEVDRPPLGDDEIELTSWDVTKLLRTVAAASDKEGGLGRKPPKPTSEMTATDSWPFETIVLPPCLVEPRIKGPMTLMTMSDPTLQQFLYDAGWEAAKTAGKELILALDSIDSSVKKGTIAKDAAKAQIGKALEGFQTSLLKQCADSVNAAWKEYSDANSQYRSYRIKASFKMALNVASISVSVAGVFAGATTGVGAVFALASAAKSVVSTARDAIMLWKDAEWLAVRLTKQLEALKTKVDQQKQSFLGVGGNEVASAVLERLTGFKKESAKKISEDAELLEKKMLAGFTKAQEASKRLPQLLQDAEKAQQKLQAALASAFEETQARATKYKIKLAIPAKFDPTHPDTAKTIATIKGALYNAPANNQFEQIMEAVQVWEGLEISHKSLTQTQKALHMLLENISELMKRYKDNKGVVEEIKNFVTLTQGQMGKVAKGIINYVVPMLDLLFVDPTSLTKPDALQTLLSKTDPTGYLQAGLLATIEVVNNVVQENVEKEFKKWVDKASSGTAYIGTVKDIITGVQDILGAITPKK